VPAALTAALILSITKPFNVVVLVAPDTAEPMLIAVVEPDTPAVPMFNVLVEPDAVAPAPNVDVCDAVAVAMVVVPPDERPLNEPVPLAVTPPCIVIEPYILALFCTAKLPCTLALLVVLNTSVTALIELVAVLY
jgi:hypothetical protein